MRTTVPDPRNIDLYTAQSRVPEEGSPRAAVTDKRFAAKIARSAKQTKRIEHPLSDSPLRASRAWRESSCFREREEPAADMRRECCADYAARRESMNTLRLRPSRFAA